MQSHVQLPSSCKFKKIRTIELGVGVEGKIKIWRVDQNRDYQDTIGRPNEKLD